MIKYQNKYKTLNTFIQDLSFLDVYDFLYFIFMNISSPFLNFSIFGYLPL